MFTPQTTERNIFTVTKLNRLVRSLLESEIGQIWLSAEISNFVAASSGHWYFTLKDERAQVKCAMFRNANRRVTQRPKEGDKVLVRANLSLYEPRGDYQLIAEHLEPEGEGLLKQQFEQLKIKLSGEGLFAMQAKQALPEVANRIGIVTSATGAALHDILTVLKRRNPSISIVIYPSQVQGDGAAAQICHAIEVANQRNEVDVLIVGRGGGSLEDLWCFNEESVARAIFASQLPVISAVGHEVDITIADFVADVRAPTPSAAAELVSQDQTELFNLIGNRVNNLIQHYRMLIKNRSAQFQTLSHRLEQTHPRHRLQQQSQHLDQLSSQLHMQMDKQLILSEQRLQAVSNRLAQCSPAHRVEQSALLHQSFLLRLKQSWQRIYSDSAERLSRNAQLLDTVSPLATLGRGYSISYNDDDIVRSIKQVKSGDELVTQLSDGEIISTVTATNDK